MLEFFNTLTQLLNACKIIREKISKKNHRMAKNIFLAFHFKTFHHIVFSKKFNNFLLKKN